MATQARFVVTFLHAGCGRSTNHKREHRRSIPRLSNHSKTPLFAFNRTFSLSLFRKFRSSVNLYRVVLDFVSFAVIGSLRLEGYSSNGFTFFRWEICPVRGLPVLYSSLSYSKIEICPAESESRSDGRRSVGRTKRASSSASPSLPSAHRSILDPSVRPSIGV